MSETDIITDFAAANQIPPILLLAIRQQESGGSNWANRMEPEYGYLWNVKTGQPYRVRPEDKTRDRAPIDFPGPRGVSASTEWISQQMSWGAFQIMGGVARSLGFTGSFLTQLCDLKTSLPLACKLLMQLRVRFKGDWQSVAAAYNGGPGAVLAPGQFTNPEYPASVLAHIEALGGGKTWPK